MSTLRDELTMDPLSRGYPGMTAADVAADLNTEYRTLDRHSVREGDITRERS